MAARWSVVVVALRSVTDRDHRDPVHGNHGDETLREMVRGIAVHDSAHRRQIARIRDASARRPDTQGRPFKDDCTGGMDRRHRERDQMIAVRTAAVAALLAATTVLAAQAPGAPTPRPPVPSRDAITARLAELRKIHTPEGIEELIEVPVGGTTQWVSIRGKNRANPVILFIHGGPGTPMMPMTWAYQTPWEDFFTVVQWDQRGVGKNARTAERAALSPTLSFDRLVADGEEMVAWLRQRLGKDRIVVMGYSYGTAIGMALAQRRPEWLHAYVGVGQVSGSGEGYLYSKLLLLAKASGNATAVRELDSIAPYPRPGVPVTSVLLTRKWARAFNGGWYGKPTFDLLFALPEWAPEYTQADLDAQLAATQWTTRTLGGGGKQPAEISALRVPIIVIQGRNDLHTPHDPALDYFNHITAPHKRFITLERSAHAPMFEEPGLFLLALVNEVLPLTEGRAAYPSR